jgi:hypothetical protein
VRWIPGTRLSRVAAAAAEINCLALGIVNDVVLNGYVRASGRIPTASFVRSIGCWYEKNTRAVSGGRRMRSITIFNYPVIATDRDEFRAGITNDREPVNRDIAVLNVRAVLRIEISHHAHAGTCVGSPRRRRIVRIVKALSV